jgi:hypothetical protein
MSFCSSVFNNIACSIKSSLSSIETNTSSLNAKTLDKDIIAERGWAHVGYGEGPPVPVLILRKITRGEFFMSHSDYRVYLLEADNITDAISDVTATAKLLECTERGDYRVNRYSGADASSFYTSLPVDPASYDIAALAAGAPTGAPRTAYYKLIVSDIFGRKVNTGAVMGLDIDGAGATAEVWADSMNRLFGVKLFDYDKGYLWNHSSWGFFKIIFQQGYDDHAGGIAWDARHRGYKRDAGSVFIKYNNDTDNLGLAGVWSTLQAGFDFFTAEDYFG